MTQAPFQAHFLTSLGLKKPGQVKGGQRLPSYFNIQRGYPSDKTVSPPMLNS
jgi:hypothetical protein